MNDARSIIDTGERTGRIHHLGRKIRAVALESPTRLRPEAPLFVHIHPSDLFDEAPFAADAQLTAVANQIVLKIAERDYLHGIQGLEGRVASLRRPGFRLAIGEIGAGRVGLTTFGLLDPDFVKLRRTGSGSSHANPAAPAASAYPYGNGRLLK